MSSSHCKKSLCKNGKCVGCKEGEAWCDDPECFPFCRGCEFSKSHEETGNWAIAIILVLLIVLFLILMISYGPNFIQLKRKGKNVQHSTSGKWMENNITIF